MLLISQTFNKRYVKITFKFQNRKETYFLKFKELVDLFGTFAQNLDFDEFIDSGQCGL